jgi:hypothetical protein
MVRNTVHADAVSFSHEDRSAWDEEIIALCDPQSVLLIERAGLTDSTQAIGMSFARATPKSSRGQRGGLGSPDAGRCHGVVRLPDLQQPDK